MGNNPEKQQRSYENIEGENTTTESSQQNPIFFPDNNLSEIPEIVEDPVLENLSENAENAENTENTLKFPSEEKKSGISISPRKSKKAYKRETEVPKNENRLSLPSLSRKSKKFQKEDGTIKGEDSEPKPKRASKLSLTKKGKDSETPMYNDLDEPFEETKNPSRLAKRTTSESDTNLETKSPSRSPKKGTPDSEEKGPTRTPIKKSLTENMDYASSLNDPDSEYFGDVIAERKSRFRITKQSSPKINRKSEKKPSPRKLKRDSSAAQTQEDAGSSAEEEGSLEHVEEGLMNKPVKKSKILGGILSRKKEESNVDDPLDSDDKKTHNFSIPNMLKSGNSTYQKENDSTAPAKTDISSKLQSLKGNYQHGDLMVSSEDPNIKNYKSTTIKVRFPGTEPPSSGELHEEDLPVEGATPSDKQSEIPADSVPSENKKKIPRNFSLGTTKILSRNNYQHETNPQDPESPPEDGNIKSYKKGPNLHLRFPSASQERARLNEPDDAKQTNEGTKDDEMNDTLNDEMEAFEDDGLRKKKKKFTNPLSRSPRLPKSVTNPSIYYENESAFPGEEKSRKPKLLASPRMRKGHQKEGEVGSSVGKSSLLSSPRYQYDTDMGAVQGNPSNQRTENI